jgi:hypothetical protein
LEGLAQAIETYGSGRLQVELKVNDALVDVSGGIGMAVECRTGLALINRC